MLSDTFDAKCAALGTRADGQLVVINKKTQAILRLTLNKLVLVRMVAGCWFDIVFIVGMVFYMLCSCF